MDMNEWRTVTLDYSTVSWLFHWKDIDRWLLFAILFKERVVTGRSMKIKVSLMCTVRYHLTCKRVQLYLNNSYLKFKRLCTDDDILVTPYLLGQRLLHFLLRLLILFNLNTRRCLFSISSLVILLYMNSFYHIWNGNEMIISQRDSFNYRELYLSHGEKRICTNEYAKKLTYMFLNCFFLWWHFWKANDTV